MKKLLILSAILLTISFYAQPPNGGGNMRSPSQRGQNNAEKPREFKASNAAGILYYDADKVVKRIKVKKPSLQSEIKLFLKEYNNKIKNIALLNSEKFEELNEEMKKYKPSQNRNFSNQNYGETTDDDDETNNEGVNIRKKVAKVIRPIKKEIRILERELNTNLEANLSEKQFEKWMKYQKSKKDKLMPKRQQNNNGGNRGNGGPPNGGGQRRMGM